MIKLFPCCFLIIFRFFILPQNAVNVALDNSIVHVSLIDDAKLDIVSSKYTRVFVYTNNPKNISKVDVKGKLMIKPFKLV